MSTIDARIDDVWSILNFRILTNFCAPFFKEIPSFLCGATPSKSLAAPQPLEYCISSRKRRGFEVRGRGGSQEGRGRWGGGKKKEKRTRKKRSVLAFFGGSQKGGFGRCSPVPKLPPKSVSLQCYPGRRKPRFFICLDPKNRNEGTVSAENIA